jgi:polysaccharide export outer membrane protein
MPRNHTFRSLFGRQIHLVGTILVLLCMVVGWGRAQTTQSPPPEAPSQQSAPQPSSVPLSPASSTYQLQPYDLIDVDVYSEEDLHKSARLGSDGTVLLPLIGSVKIGGLTVAQATDVIRTRYAGGFVKNPSVLVTVLEYRKSNFSILGQVQKPGNYDIPEGARISVVDAISLAGGYLPNAAQNAVTVKRMVDGTLAILKVRAGDMAQDPVVVPFEILPGDIILVIPEQYGKNSFSMLGQVQKPGVYDIPEGSHMTVVDALSLAGGFTPNASQNDVNVKRMVHGELSIFKVKAGDMTEDPDVVPFEILPGDIVLVQYRNSAFSILGQIQKPGIYAIPEGAHISIIDAILMAGGYTRVAAQNSVTVKRLVEGKLTIFKVKAGDMAKDPGVVPFEVLPGDIVTVNESWF